MERIPVDSKRLATFRADLKEELQKYKDTLEQQLSTPPSIVEIARHLDAGTEHGAAWYPGKLWKVILAETTTTYALSTQDPEVKAAVKQYVEAARRLYFDRVRTLGVKRLHIFLAQLSGLVRI